MLAGYNQPRPALENYQDFMTKLVSGLHDFNNEGLSLIVYGSYVRKDMDVGRSDIDAVLIFADDVIIDKKQLSLCSEIVAHALRNNHVPFQVTVTDLSLMKDGRFNSYNSSFADYFKQESVILAGPDYRAQFRYTTPQHPEQGPLTFNIRKSRQGLLLAQYDQEHDYEQFLRKFNKSLDSVSRGSKQILYMANEQLTKNRFSALEKIKIEFPKIDTEPLKQIKELYRHPQRLDHIYHEPQEIMNIWNSAVSFLEELVREYILNVPISVE